MGNEYQRKYVPTQNVKCSDPFYIAIFIHIFVFISSCIFASVILIYADQMVVDIQMPLLLSHKKNTGYDHSSTPFNLLASKNNVKDGYKEIKLSYNLC